jgi:hypothetical protein
MISPGERLEARFEAAADRLGGQTQAGVDVNSGAPECGSTLRWVLFVDASMVDSSRSGTAVT